MVTVTGHFAHVRSNRHVVCMSQPSQPTQPPQPSNAALQENTFEHGGNSGCDFVVIYMLSLQGETRYLKSGCVGCDGGGDGSIRASAQRLSHCMYISTNAIDAIAAGRRISPYPFRFLLVCNSGMRSDKTVYNYLLV